MELNGLIKAYTKHPNPHNIPQTSLPWNTVQPSVKKIMSKNLSPAAKSKPYIDFEKELWDAANELR